MKNSKSCPKCRSPDIVRVPGAVGAYGSGNNINASTKLWDFGGFVMVTRYVCGDCGFSEEWIDSADDIAKLKKKYPTE